MSDFLYYLFIGVGFLFLVYVAPVLFEIWRRGGFDK